MDGSITGPGKSRESPSMKQKAWLNVNTHRFQSFSNCASILFPSPMFGFPIVAHISVSHRILGETPVFVTQEDTDLSIHVLIHGACNREKGAYACAGDGPRHL